MKVSRDCHVFEDAVPDFEYPDAVFEDPEAVFEDPVNITKTV